MAGRGYILPESVIGQLLPADADEASREALNVIFDVGRQALPGSMRLCLRQLWNKQGISEVQTGMASSSLLYPVNLSNTLATQASRLQNRLSQSLVCSKRQVFPNAHPVDFSLQSKRLSEFTWAVERCFLFLEEWMHIVRGMICVSPCLFQQGRQTVNYKRRPSNRRFPVQTVFRKCGNVLKFIFSIQIIGLGSLVSNGVASRSFSSGHTSEAYDTCKSNVARPGMDSSLFRCRNTFFSSVRPVPSQWIKFCCWGASFTKTCSYGHGGNAGLF